MSGMSDLESILSSAQGGQLVANLAQRFGLTDEQIDAAIKALAPALAIGLNRAAEEPQVFEKTVGALATTTRYSFFDEADAAHSQDSVELGRDLLTELFGSPAATGQVLQAAARESGVRPDILSQLLPILASVLLSGLTKSINEKGLGGILGQLANSGALGPILEQILGGGQAAPQPAPGPAPRGGAAGGGLGGLLGGILGSLLGGRRAPPGGGMAPRGPDRGSPLDVDAGQSGSGPAGLPAGLDQAAIQDAIEQIKKTLQVGQNAGGRPAGQTPTDLESILGQILGKR
ncbi:DUF937 domain-containing protein [Methylocystis parvus]|uniref:DUF937 domain-containing protein n=1 Tax=Methylocystis parvus TaxID=134 RepID=UPI003C706BDB